MGLRRALAMIGGDWSELYGWYLVPLPASRGPRRMRLARVFGTLAVSA